MNAHPQWPTQRRLASVPLPHRHPRERLQELQEDRREAKARLREVLETLADKYGISAKDVSYAIDGYADDMLSDLVFGCERDMEQAVEEEDSANRGDR
jgi:hypothetical protein